MVILIKVFLKENYSITEGAMPPEVNLLNEKNNGENVLKLIQDNLILSAHDISDGGLNSCFKRNVNFIKLWSKNTKTKKIN